MYKLYVQKTEFCMRYHIVKIITKRDYRKPDTAGYLFQNKPKLKPDKYCRMIQNIIFDINLLKSNR